MRSPGETGGDHEGTEPTEIRLPGASDKPLGTYDVNYILKMNKRCSHQALQILKCEPVSLLVN